MTPERHHTDDDIRRWDAKWLGPDKGDRGGFTLPWAASYVAYGLWLVAFIVILGIEAITPLTIGKPLPIREAAAAVLIATFVSGKVNHDKPLRALLPTLIQNLRSPRRITTTQRSGNRYAQVRIEDRS